MTDPLELELPAAVELACGQSLVFGFCRDGEQEQGFLLRLEQGYVAFANRCPHWNVDLDMGDEHFYDPDVDRIFCKNHAATFLPRDGTCDSGPCRGKALERFEVLVEGRRVAVLVPDAQPL